MLPQLEKPPPCASGAALGRGKSDLSLVIGSQEGFEVAKQSLGAFFLPIIVGFNRISKYF